MFPAGAQAESVCCRDQKDRSGLKIRPFVEFEQLKLRCGVIEMRQRICRVAEVFGGT